MESEGDLIADYGPSSLDQEEGSVESDIEHREGKSSRRREGVPENVTGKAIEVSFH